MTMTESQTENKVIADTWTVGDFISKAYKFVIGHYQRGYRWEEKEITQLLGDLEAAQEDDMSQYLLGAITLFHEDANNENMEVVDGQQRLTTLALIAVSLNRKLNHYLRVGVQLTTEETVLFQQHSAALSNALSAGEQTSAVFIEFKRGAEKQAFSDYMNPEYQNNIQHSIIANAVSILDTWINKQSLSDLVQFTDYLLKKTAFVTIIAPSESSAFRLFETLNDRGKALKKIDLLRNTLFMWLAEDKHSECAKILDDAETFFTNVSNGRTSDGHFAALFTQCLEASIDREGKQNIEDSKLFDEAKNALKDLTASKVYNFFRDTFNLNTQKNYLASVRADQPLWSDFEGALKNRNKTIVKYKIFNTTIFSLFLAYQNKTISKEIVVNILWDLYSLIRRTMLLGRIPSANYAPIMARFARQVQTHPSDTLENFKITLNKLFQIKGGLYPDETFIPLLSANPNLKESTAKDILLDLQNSSLDSAGTIAPKEDLHAEHIYPQNPKDGEWEHFIDNPELTLLNRLGNFALLSGIRNQQISNEGFNYKKENAYKNSNFEMTRSLSDLDCWDKEAIEKRSNDLAIKTANILTFKTYEL